jgi:hypothetical protein
MTDPFSNSEPNISSPLLIILLALRVRVKISSQIFSVEAPAWQCAKVQENLAYSELSQRSQAGCIGAKNVKLFLREPLTPLFNLTERT